MRAEYRSRAGLTHPDGGGRIIRMRTSFVAVALLLAAHPGTAVSQSPTPADLAAKLTGRWKLNTALSQPFPGVGEGRRGGGPAFALAGALPQRGGRGGTGSGEPGVEAPFVTTEEAAAQTALAAIQQLPSELTIEATAADMKLTEARGDSFFKIDGKNTTIQVPGATMKVKSKWERAALRQEFSTALRSLVRSWSVNADGRLVVTQRAQSARFVSKDVQTVFDRQ